MKTTTQRKILAPAGRLYRSMSKRVDWEPTVPWEAPLPEIREGEGSVDLDMVLDEVCQHVEAVSGEVPSAETKAVLAKLIRKSVDAGVTDPQQLKDDAIAALPHCIPANGG